MNTQTEERKIIYLSPATDIIEEEGKFLLRSDLPGVQRDDLQVTVENNLLEFEGKTSGEQFNLEYTEGTPDYHYRRRFKLNQEIDSTKINAHLDNGVLTLELGKSEALKPRKIEVLSAQ